MVVVPDMKVIGLVGAMVVALAMVGAAAAVEVADEICTTPENCALLSWSMTRACDEVDEPFAVVRNDRDVPFAVDVHASVAIARMIAMLLLHPGPPVTK